MPDAQSLIAHSSSVRKHASRRALLWLTLMLASLSPALSGCVFWQAPAPTTEELDAGLIVLYPGAYNSQWEMQAFYEGLRAAGRAEAIEIVAWAGPLEQWTEPEGFYDELCTWSTKEAERLAAYKAAHADAPVTLLGFSSGAMTAILVTERLPEEVLVDRVVMLSAGVSQGYDLGPMLAHVRDGAVVYFSPVDDLAIELVAEYGTIDGDFKTPAATFGFTAQYDTLVQIPWDPSMATYGNNGDHLDYLRLPDWIRDTVAPWLATPAEKPHAQTPPA